MNDLKFPFSFALPCLHLPDEGSETPPQSEVPGLRLTVTVGVVHTAVKVTCASGRRGPQGDHTAPS